LAWRPGSYSRLDTPHFVIYSRADAATGRRVAEDLERCFWVWTQLFFPLWESHRQLDLAFAQLSPDESISQFLDRTPARLTPRKKLRVVLLRDAAEYQRTINVPGAERSTGFYSDRHQTTFLYQNVPDDRATRRHELVHQLFREATASRLGRALPGEDSGFWLVEGIAGYFESLHFGPGHATVGGWESPRLQFARYRYFVVGDRMPLEELVRDGRAAAQSRADIARWYAHAIARTHSLLDGDDRRARQWVYSQLADLYKIDSEITGSSGVSLASDDVLPFLSINDRHIADNPTSRELAHLCLAGCQVTTDGLNRIPESRRLQRLVLTGQPIDVPAVQRLVAQPQVLRQLSLERTEIDNEITGLLENAGELREVDLSNTAVDDAIVSAIAGANELSTLWLTGTQVSDRSIETIARFPALRHVDVQNTDVTPTGLAKLRDLRPELDINPLAFDGS